MKKILFGILTFLGIGLSFCSAEYYYGDSFSCYLGTPIDGYNECIDDYLIYGQIDQNLPSGQYRLTVSSPDVSFYGLFAPVDSLPSDISADIYPGFTYDFSYEYGGAHYGFNFWYFHDVSGSGLVTFTIASIGGGNNSGGNEDTGIVSTIDVYYNNGNSTETITCDGTQAISIDGLSTITSTNTFTPYYNISYTDEDNQKLTESYSNSILYLENGQFKKTYTGNNDWILFVQGGSENSFSGYLPTFDITGGIEEVSESGNIFNNFAENSVKFTLSNIPSYIQYVILLMLLFFILGFIRKFRRK